MENIIFLTLDLVYPDDTGGRKLSLGRILHEREKGNRVVVIHYNYKNQNEEEAKCFFKRNNILYYSFTKKHKSHRFTRFLNYVKACLKLMPEPYFLIDNDVAFRMYLQKKIVEIEPTLISMESIFLGGLRDLANVKKSKLNYTLHNVESEFYFSLCFSEAKKIKKLHYYIQACLLKLIERNIFRNAYKSNDINFTFLSQEDKKKYKEKHIINEDACLINHNNIRTTRRVNREVKFNDPFFLFPGSLDFPANSYSIKKLFENPDIDWGLLPKIVITGSVSDTIRNDFSIYKNISLVGRVPENELHELYSTCIACISPIITGGGIKIKNIEAIKLGIPLIATEFSCIGIDTSAENVIVTENDSCSFYEAMLEYYYELLNNNTLEIKNTSLRSS
ncbi:glycosyltransferase [Intestinirhabdus alba]|uniref:Glycosyltransferase n=1 Tax=Intestinirhabdus alba TaxID=2899544 RepID=A0A6L6IP87_9ENTR|nr:glycosyltransferase [Intestinirhabdus alba]